MKTIKIDIDKEDLQTIITMLDSEYDGAYEMVVDMVRDRYSTFEQIEEMKKTRDQLKRIHDELKGQYVKHK